MPRRGRPVVLVTRADEPDAIFSNRLAGRNIDVEWMPTIAVVPPEQPRLLDAALTRLAAFDWIVFTSRHAVDAVVNHPLWRNAWNAPTPMRLRLAAVGPVTARRLVQRGYPPDIELDEGGGARLAAAIVAVHGGTLTGVRLLWPGSSMARREFADQVRVAGGWLTEVVAYRTVAIAPDRATSVLRHVHARVFDAVAFFSPSAASSLAAAVGRGSLACLSGHTLVASIGPTTSSALRALGAPPDLEAPLHTALSLADGLAQRLVP